MASAAAIISSAGTILHTLPEELDALETAVVVVAATRSLGSVAEATAPSPRMVWYRVPLAARLLLASSTALVYALPSAYVTMFAQLTGVLVIVVVTGPVHIGHPAQVDSTTGGRVPPT